ncbi:MAG: hypothetical protein HQ579_04260 [Candidatus Omnitrophica bacterium]|nr:hypothetical protein [Candidatus Omnitrophota bacterium]
MKLNKKNIIKLICIVWVIFWVNFILRELFFKGRLFRDYKELIFKNEELRKSFVYGINFYSLLKLAQKELPESATFSLVGVERLSLDYRRAVYYLYPLLESEKADYLLVYKKYGFVKNGYKKIVAVDRETFILKRI